MANPERFDRMGRQALEALADMAAQSAYIEPPRPGRVADLPQPQFRESGYEEPARPSRVARLPLPEFPEEGQPSLHFVKNSLNGGEVSPDLACRFDQQRVAMGCHELLNMIPLPWGGARKRPGLEFVAWARRGDPAATTRLVPFVFAEDQSRILEFSAGAGRGADMRVFDAEGQLLHSQAGMLPLDGKGIAEMTFCQSADVIFLAHPEMRPAKLMRYGDTDWRFETIQWMPDIEAPEWDWVGPRGPEPSGEGRRVNLEYVCTAISEETGEESMPSEVWTLSGQFPLTESRYVELRPREVAGASEYRVYKKSQGVFGFIGRITEKSAVTDEEGGEETEAWLLEDKNIAADTEDTPPRARDPFREEGERPAVVFLHQQRLGYAASEGHPLTIWLSQTGNYESMAASIPPADDDAIEATLAAPRANSILWAMSDRSGLLMGTQGGEWLCCPGTGAALTPSDLSFQPQCEYGSQAGLWPERVASGLIFAQRGGRAVRDLGYSFQDDRYSAADLSILARHIFRGRKIRSWAWQKEPWAILWMALSDGTMAGLTYLRENEIMAWHRHETDGRIESVCSIPAPDGTDAVFMTVLRPQPGGPRRSLEKLGSPNDATADTLYRDGPDLADFRARCVPCLPEESLQNGSSFLMCKKINSIKVAVLNSKPFRARVTSQEAMDSPARDVPARPRGFASRAHWNCPLGAGWRENSRLELILDGPDPVTITGLTICLEVADMAGGQR